MLFTVWGGGGLRKTAEGRKAIIRSNSQKRWWVRLPAPVPVGTVDEGADEGNKGGVFFGGGGGRGSGNGGKNLLFEKKKYVIGFTIMYRRKV